jgi:dienelactone hydrolase
MTTTRPNPGFVRLPLAPGAGALVRAGAWARAAALATVVGALVTVAAPASAADTQAVTFAARDGVTVTGTLHLPDRLPAPAVVLLPMLSRTQHDYDGLSARLAESGIASLAIDFRRNGGPRPDAAGGAEDFTDLVLDADAARAYLAARPDISPARIGFVGASIGANVAVLAAANEPGVKTLVLLSPSLEYRNLRLEQALKAFGGRPALLVASSNDPYALRTVREAVSFGDGSRELRVLSNAGHGTVMLAREPDLTGAVVDWLLRTLL